MRKRGDEAPQAKRVSSCSFQSFASALLGISLLYFGDTMEVDEKEDVQEAQDNVAEPATSSKKKKRKIRPYHRIHAHRNPLSDANFE